jgi:hypothetical protein
MAAHERFPVTRSIAVVAMALSATACFNGTEQSADSVTALFGAALEACAQPAAADGSFDQKAIAAAGWRLRSRVVYKEAEERSADLDRLPDLREPEYESTRWARDGHVGELEVSRWPASTRSISDRCSVSARLQSSGDVQAVVSALTAKTGVAIGAQGQVPRGGDYLLPRRTIFDYQYRWPTPLHQVHLLVFDETDLRLDIQHSPGDGNAYPLPSTTTPGLLIK